MEASPQSTQLLLQKKRKREIEREEGGGERILASYLGAMIIHANNIPLKLIN